MSTNILVVHTRAVAGREDEFNEWYDTVHVPDILRIPGFVSAKRYRQSPERRNDATPLHPYEYLAIYEIDGLTPREAWDRLNEAVRSMFMSSALDPERMVGLFEPM